MIQAGTAATLFIFSDDIFVVLSNDISFFEIRQAFKNLLHRWVLHELIRLCKVAFHVVNHTDADLLADFVFLQTISQPIRQFLITGNFFVFVRQLADLLAQSFNFWSSFFYLGCHGLELFLVIGLNLLNEVLIHQLDLCQSTANLRIKTSDNLVESCRYDA